MLLIEWDYWHEQMPSFEAEERYGAYTVALLAHPEWTVDRDSVLESWRALMDRRRPAHSLSGDLDDDQTGAVRRGAKRVAGWLRSHFGGIAEGRG